VTDQKGLRLLVPDERDDGPDAVRDFVDAVAVVVGSHEKDDDLESIL
jgi:hypothetical protein